MKHIAIIILLALMLPSIRSYAQYNKEISLKVSIEDFGFEYDNNIESAYLSVKDISGLKERIINISPDSQNVSLNWANNKRGVFVISLFVNNILCDSKRVIGL